jgi:hypothetical protein
MLLILVIICRLLISFTGIAIKLEQNHPNENGCTKPSTKVHILIDKLQKQKNFE